jgi:hypothetical protein
MKKLITFLRFHTLDEKELWGFEVPKREKQIKKEIKFFRLANLILFLSRALSLKPALRIFVCHRVPPTTQMQNILSLPLTFPFRL